MRCECEKPNPRDITRACRNCGRYVTQAPLLSVGMFQREACKIMNNQVFWLSQHSRDSLPEIPRRVKVARHIKEMRRRFRNAKAAMNGAWETDTDD